MMVGDNNQSRGRHARHAEPYREPAQARASQRAQCVDNNRGKDPASRYRSENDPAARYRRDSDPAAQYRRDNFTIPKKRGKKKKVLIGILSVLLVLIGVGLAYGAWYTGKLNDALSMDNADELNNALVDKGIDEPFYMLVLGSDSREDSGTSTLESESGSQQRSDVMILVRVDASERVITMVTIPRDTPITSSDGTKTKINEAYNAGGASYAIEKTSELTGVDISHYAEIHFSEFEELVDKLGGVTVDVPTEMSYEDALTGETVTLQPGEQTLDGQQAQIFVRVRKSLEGNQEAARQNNVRTMAMAILDKALSKPFYELPDAVLDLAECVGTDFKAGDLVALALDYASGSSKLTIYSCSGPSEGARDDETGTWFCYENPEGWEKLIDVVDSGEDPSNVDVESSAIIP